MESSAVEISWPSSTVESFEPSFDIRIDEGNSSDTLDFPESTKSPACARQDIPKPPPLPRRRLNRAPAASCAVPRETKDLWEKLFIEGYGADVHIVTDDGSKIAAHHSILSIASPVLGNFLVQMQIKNHVRLRAIRIPGPSDAVRAFIRFLYSSCYDEEVMQKFVLHLLVLSHTYAVPSLKRVCEYTLEQGWLTKENVVDVLKLSRSCDAPRLSMVCLRMVVRDFKCISATEAWKVMRHADPALEQELLESVIEEDSRRQERLKKVEEKKVYVLNDGTIMTISKDRVKPSPVPDSWKLKEIFATGVVLGGYLALGTVLFFWLVKDTTFLSDKFGVRSLKDSPEEIMAVLYLQVSIVSQALIFVTRSRSWSFAERPGMFLLGAFLIAQLVATLIAVYANWSFAKIRGCGWGWAGVIWLYSVVTYFPLDILKFCIRYVLSGKAWDNLLENKTAFTTKSNYGKEEREAQWAAAQRTLHGLQPPETANLFNEKNSYRELSEIAEQAKRRAEVARLRELHTLKGHVESVVKLKGLDIDTIQQHYTV